MTRSALALVVALAVGLGFPGLAAAVDVHFKPGTSSASYKGTVRGYDTVQYKLGARAGQTMSVSFSTRSTAAYYNVIAPGADSAMFRSEMSDGGFNQVLPADGTYTVEVYLVRAAARRNEHADFTIGFSIDGSGSGALRSAPSQADAMPPVPQPDFADGYGGGPDFWRVSGLTAGDTLNVRAGPSAGDAIVVKLDEGAVVRNLGCRPVSGARWCRIQLTGNSDMKGWVNGRYLREAAAAPSNDAIVPGTHYHATGLLDCRFKGDAAVRSCRFGVVREGSGRAAVDITFPDGFKRTLHFSGGLVTTSGGGQVSVKRESDNTLVTVDGTERFVVPDVVVEGD